MTTVIKFINNTIIVIEFFLFKIHDIALLWKMECEFEMTERFDENFDRCV